MKLVPVDYAKASSLQRLLHGLVKDNRIDPEYDARGRARPGFLATEATRRTKSGKPIYKRRQPYNILLGVWVDGSRYNGAALRGIRAKNGVGKRRAS